LRGFVIPIGKGWREQKADVDGTDLRIFISGEWLFADNDTLAMSAEIYREYRKIFGSEPRDGVKILIVKFPTGAAPGLWQAETRAGTVTILSGDMNFKTQSLQRLHEQLRHEIFHLWLPNGVNLSGNYDWFYEGFALYQSLKTAVYLNRIRFEDFLETLSRAHDIDGAQTRRSSLIEAAANRWNGGDTAVYARGMITAFLCDVAMLNRSGGKRSISEVVHGVFQKHRSPAVDVDGNTAVLEVMQEFPELASVVEKLVKGSEPIDWAAQIALAGIEAVTEGRHNNLKVREKLSGRQKTVLDKLGYNSWRKLARSSK
jgi:predicted metalloprotease with PDZ domain